MPRGSRPGERRGGRRGTPNRKTILKNAVFCAAAQNDASPLHFMLGLMRNSDAPTDLRIEMAVAAAPFVHARPQAARRIRTNPLDSSPIKCSADISVPKIDGGLSAPGELTTPEQSVDGKDELSPLNFLLSVMKDPDAAPKQRIKAAKIAARYQHAPVLPDKMPSTDEFGFTINRTLAKAIFDDWRRLNALEETIHRRVSDNCMSEAAEKGCKRPRPSKICGVGSKGAS